MRFTILALLWLLLLATAAWSADDKEDTEDKDDKDSKALTHLQTIGGSYFGTGDEFLYSGVTVDPGAVVPESVSDGEPVDHAHGDLDHPQPADNDGRYDLGYYGQDSVVGPLWGVPGETIPETGVAPDDPRATDPHVAHPEAEEVPDEAADGIRRTKDGKIVIFKSSADTIYDD